jgi:hypothetical protein
MHGHGVVVTGTAVAGTAEGTPSACCPATVAGDPEPAGARRIGHDGRQGQQVAVNLTA